MELQSRLNIRSDHARYLKEAKLLIWEEMPMANKAAIECADAFMRELKGSNKPFGGTVFLGLGDFRQVAPVIKGSGPTATFEASIRSSELWSSFKVLQLDTPIRNAADPEYSTWIDRIGEGLLHPGCMSADIKLDLIQQLETLETVISFLFPSTILNDPLQSSKRAFLSPLNIYVNDFNTLILHKLDTNEGKLVI